MSEKCNADEDFKEKETNDPSGHESESLADEISKLTIQNEGKANEIEKVGEKKEASSAVKEFARWIQEEECCNILVLTGAGVSVAAGIPDFRTPGTGLYDNLQKYNLPFPEAVFDLGFYRRTPAPFCSLAREMWPGLKHAPTLTHSFVALLAKKELLLRNYSQNIDGLEFLADTPADLLVECHGHYRTASCIDCGKAADASATKKSVVNEGKPINCTKCSGLVKPDIVFFGESLPDRFHKLLVKDRLKADLVLVLGTSLQVAPVSQIPEMVSGSCKRALVNREVVGSFEYTCRDMETATGKRDLFLAGDCDDTIQQIALELGWLEELKEMHQRAVTNVKKGEN